LKIFVGKELDYEMKEVDNLLTCVLLFHSLHIVLLGFLFLSPLSASRLKITHRSFFHSATVLWNSLPSDLRHVAHHVTPSPILNSPVSDLSTSLFLEKLKTISFTVIFLLSLYSPRRSQN